MREGAKLREVFTNLEAATEKTPSCDRFLKVANPSEGPLLKILGVGVVHMEIYNPSDILYLQCLGLYIYR